MPHSVATWKPPAMSQGNQRRKCVHPSSLVWYSFIHWFMVSPNDDRFGNWVTWSEHSSLVRRHNTSSSSRRRKAPSVTTQSIPPLWACPGTPRYKMARPEYTLPFSSNKYISLKRFFYSSQDARPWRRLLPPVLCSENIDRHDPHRWDFV